MNAESYSIQALVAAGSLFVSNHSGGKDSQAMLIKLLEIIPATQIVVVHASLGAMEWPGALELAKQQAEDAGLPFIVARANKTMLEMVERRFKNRPEVPSWPSASTRQCTSDLKRGPIQREVRAYAKANGFKTIVNFLGLRAQESPGRAKRKIFSQMSISNSVHTWFEWLPVHDLPTDEIFATIRSAGQEPHYAYGLGNERLSCVFCIMSSRNDLKNGAAHHPDLLDRYAEMEEETGYTMHMSRIPIKELAA
ncbi:phosphoadenosine phosphosulfate reductase family protein [Aeromonas salmonicida subsp. salmonicida]|uniref:Phage phosphoadenosine phosphosulfate reductase n=1 Tax=Aeromonas salmonicida subsp. salmonicida TaxID=29491 RepID=A0A0B0F364_AERSS|nr:phosphoadenosine phosphosulfate reductase family protein [Aeromonas salmonicida]AIZ49711.1 phage phosphoadenosine phosphosulfate reductase [Aeromonas salmonicida subsp. salmonicida]ELI6443079.1 phosphoadenosine phosphosulfate reductase family protein [Aeromonas salmonicida subsp. salmonicida]KHE97385.1 phosphoadenosine phosphosulfate reductase [Aeromonas salmonicida subsp. salmonicida]KHE98666.1 phosphoadenosine phosphosulfate reductase [Aeromonas salmonicida subsp. salmonicida]OKA85932.1 p